MCLSKQRFRSICPSSIEARVLLMEFAFDAQLVRHVHARYRTRRTPVRQPCNRIKPHFRGARFSPHPRNGCLHHEDNASACTPALQVIGAGALVLMGTLRSCTLRMLKAARCRCCPSLVVGALVLMGTLRVQARLRLATFAALMGTLRVQARLRLAALAALVDTLRV
ncbi:hypothetical protein SDRG_15317 [Saprolegnia diclina VS20]|uniref:Uncharacterized protein n=1 Tax=Saprolegnia diclina (strain VS20) TaxID=1156394 RepID=T0Q0B4_SAPDV|nr:hypothetical protein SDRG_15317 [Saprolegnia diclina VS20]EQC26805.1 hypothetical protein SDRG_15317 [Saprolegnia diclina VS20]|eukprot:XP_008619707.1 hypothetical protein SDRG_15317 [Saprolegnia diclina VS20]